MYCLHCIADRMPVMSEPSSSTSTSASPGVPLTGLRSPGRIGSALRAARTIAGLTQSEVAAAAGVSRDALSRIENGQRGARAETLCAVLDVCGYEMSFLPRTQSAQRMRDRAKGLSGS